MHMATQQAVPSQRRTARDFGQWRDLVNEHFPWIELRAASRRSFRASVQARRLGVNLLAIVSSDASEAIRTPRQASASECGYIKWLWLEQGRMEIRQGTKRLELAPGQAGVCDTARPYRVRFDDPVRFTVLTLPYDAMPGWERISELASSTPLAASATIAAAHAALTCLLMHPETSDAQGAGDVLQAVQQMLCTSLYRSLNSTAGRRDPACIMHRAHRYVLEHIDNPDLSPDEMAMALCLSRRRLYSLFRKYRLSPARFIRDVRIEACREALANPLHSRRSVLEIALEHGFSDGATFSRCFRKHCGTSPSEWRREAMSASH